MSNLLVGRKSDDRQAVREKPVSDGRSGQTVKRVRRPAMRFVLFFRAATNLEDMKAGVAKAMKDA